MEASKSTVYMYASINQLAQFSNFLKIVVEEDAVLLHVL